MTQAHELTIVGQPAPRVEGFEKVTGGAKYVADIPAPGALAGKILRSPLMPLMVLLATLNFVSAAGATASVILLASRETITLSILALQWASNDIGRFEAAGIVSLHVILLTLGVAALARRFGLNMGVRHR